jgi:hypothetical protein
MCFITLFIKKENTAGDVDRYTRAMKEIAGKYCKSFAFKVSKSGKRLTVFDLCEVKKTKNADQTLRKMIAEVNERTNGTAGGWLCKRFC